MFKILTFLLLPAAVCHAATLVTPATQAEVNAGLNRTRYVTPNTLSNWNRAGSGTLTTNFNLLRVTNSARAGSLTVDTSVTLGGVARTNWPSDGTNDLTTVIANVNTVSNRQAVWLEDFGGRGDGRKIYGYTISSGTVTAPGATFAATDTNKVFLGYQDSTNLTYFLATITNVVSATEVQLNTNLTSAVSREGQYGSRYVNTLAVSNILATATGDVTIRAGPGVFLFDGLIQASSGGRTIIQLPAPASIPSTNPWRTISFVGSSPAVVYPQTATNGSSAIGYQTAGTIFMPISKPVAGVTNSFFESHADTGIYNGFAWHSVHFENLTFRHPPNPQLTTWQFARGGYRSSRNCSIDADIPPNYLSAMGDPIFFPASKASNAASSVIAVYNPDVYNYAGSLDQELSVSYQGCAIRVTEHAKLIGHTAIVGCGSGIFIDGVTNNFGNTSLSFDDLIVFCSQWPIVVGTNSGAGLTPGRQVVAGRFAKFETHSVRTNGWTGYHITDPADRLQGTIAVLSGYETPLVQSTKLNWYDGVNNVWYQAASSFSGANITANSINSNRLDSATRAMFGAGGSTTNVFSAITVNSAGITNVSSGNTNLFGLGTFGAGYPYGTLKVGDGTMTKPGFWLMPTDNGTGNGRDIYFALSSKLNLADSTERTFSLTLDAANRRGIIGTGTQGDGAFGPSQIIIDPDLLTIGLEEYRSVIFDTNGMNKFFGAAVFCTNGLAGTFGYSGVSMVVSNGLAVFRAGAAPHLSLSAAPPVPPSNGGSLFCDGTNLCIVLQNAAGVKTTNKLSMTAWP